MNQAAGSRVRDRAAEEGSEPPAGVDVREAASLLIVSASRGGRVLMGRRPGDARFMPGYYVFPGGALDHSDWRVPVSGDLAGRDVNLMRVASPGQARALAIAAIRETFEETGILCCCDESSRAPNWQDVFEGRCPPDLAHLEYLGRALTPRISHIRFHARFFFLIRENDDLPLAATPELDDLRWVDHADIPDVPMARVTRFMLDELTRRLESPAPPVLVPFYCRDTGEPEVVYDAPLPPGSTDGQDSRKP